MNIVIPDSVITIGDYAFENCSKLQSITISRSASDGIITLGRLVFIDCSALASIYVPAGSVEEYKAAENWKDYASKIKAIEA
jgi:hypothetical protein